MNTDEHNEHDIEIDLNSDLDDSVVAEENQAETIKKLREKLKKTEEEKLEYLTGWQRTKADFINLRKKDEEMKGEIVKYANEDLISQVLPVIDSFQMAFSNKEAWEALPKEWRGGMESIYNQLIQTLMQNGLVIEELLGKPFDPKFAEAIGTIKVDSKDKDHTVVTVLQPCYILNGKIIRIAKVTVGQYEESH
jgi:molecular chaperone GrpE